MTDLQLYEEIVRLTRAGTHFAVATVIESAGSAPRQPGAKMLVRGDGTILGTVGGGRVEADTIQAALEAIRRGTPATLPFQLTEEHGFVCGGSLRVYVEPHAPSRRLVMVGAGHVGREVAKLARRCGFHVTVVDRREELANRKELPDADEVICCPEPEAFARISVTPDTAIVIATTSHDLDFDVVRGALETEAGFIGLVGSKRKRDALRQTLAAEGVPERELERIVAPVGLAIGAETPAEIAVSIAAQLIQVGRNHADARIGDPPGRRLFPADGAVQAAPSP